MAAQPQWRARGESQNTYPAQRSRAEGRRYCAHQAQNAHNLTQLSARRGASKAGKTRLTRHRKNWHAICNMKIWRPQPYGKPCRRVSDRSESRARGLPQTTRQPGTGGRERSEEGGSRCRRSSRRSLACVFARLEQNQMKTNG